MHKIIRAYDIRGQYPHDLTIEKTAHFARQFSYSLPQNAQVVIGRDGRVHSPQLSRIFIDILLEEGIHVIDIGLVATPVVWFALATKDIEAGIMVTASHNPPEDNGFKIALKDRPLIGEDFLKMMNLSAVKRHCKGILTAEDIKPAYIQRLLQKFSPSLSQKIIFDTAHGAAGPLIAMLDLPCSTLLHGEVDGTFPAHEPDPTKEKNMEILKEHVLRTKAEMGIGLDGDGDRLGVIDRHGRLVPTELLLIVWIKTILQKNPGATIVGDIKSSRFVKETVLQHGGKFVMCRTGHSYIKHKMKETGAIFGGEVSGHIFFADDYYGFDDALYASLRLLMIEEDLTTLHNPYHIYDVQIPCADVKKFTVIDHIKAQCLADNVLFNDLDGVRVDQEKGWWLIRASNTQALITGRCEGATKEDLEFMQKEMMHYLELFHKQ